MCPTYRRHIPLVAQQPAILPGKTVAENVAYGLESAAGSGTDLGRVHALLKLCRIESLARKLPGTLSGGEQQRVALARALAPPGTRALLLDEPFSGMDLHLRDALLADLVGSKWIESFPVLHVTHDVAEAFALNAEILRLEQGRIVAQGPVAEVLQAERRLLLDSLGATGPRA